MIYFVKKSISLGVNKIDWIRTIYFSLFGSSALTLATKFQSFTFLPRILFFIGVLFFLFGLISSMRISDTFKNAETLHKENPAINRQYSTVKEYLQSEEKKGFLKPASHFANFTCFFLA